MADTCIVCLGDLRTTLAEDTTPEAAAASVPAADDANDAKNVADTNEKSIQDDDEAIAHLLPCKHDLHNSCLTPWVERANSCPICRTVFNMVEVSRTVGGHVIDSYPVKDKAQEAEIDASMIIEDELFGVEAWEPCLICGVLDDGNGSMYCDGCNRAVHVFCAGHDDAPEVWYCETCLVDLENDTDLPGMASALGRRARRNGNTIGPRPQPRPQTRRRPRNDALWARVWQEVSRRLDLDLDFPFDEEQAVDHRTEEQRREFRRWQRRFEVANSQGAANRLRGIANAQLNPSTAPAPNPESQDEIRAWNAFDKARESQEDTSTTRRRKRKATDSPASPQEEAVEQPQLKRPRLRRPPTAAPEQPESSNSAARRQVEEPTFLSSLLHEVENKAVSAASPATSDYGHGQQSPRISSPVRSPASSDCGSPNIAGSPPPNRPLSPPLSSELVPATSPLGQTFSPFSPAGSRIDLVSPNMLVRRGRTRRQRDDGDEAKDNAGRQSSNSPSRILSYSAKEEIQRMVKLTLGARYRDKEITKDQYTDINRDVSRKMYELVGDASALSDQAEREKWQNVANEEVHKAILVISAAIADE